MVASNQATVNNENKQIAIDKNIVIQFVSVMKPKGKEKDDTYLITSILQYLHIIMCTPYKAIFEA